MYPQFSIIFVILIGFIVSQGLAQSLNATDNIYCYDCDPQNNLEACSDPGKSGVKQTLCNKLPKQHENSTFICLSANITFFGSSSNQTGIYRGCFEQEVSVASFCDYFKEEIDYKNALLVSCLPCNSTRCNNVTFTSDGYPDTNKSSSFMNVAFMVTIVSILFSLLF